MKLHQSKLLNIIIVIIIIFSGSYAYCTEEVEKKTRTTDRLFTEMAVITGLGASNIPEGNYQPILLIGRFGINLKRYSPELKNHHVIFSFFLEPQFNTVVNPTTGFEFGIGIGVQYMYPLSDKLSHICYGKYWTALHFCSYDA